MAKGATASDPTRELSEVAQAVSDYPSNDRRTRKGRQIFALRFLDALRLSRDMQELGEACNLLMTIVLIEDKKTYRGPVTFTNDELADSLGWSHRTLDRLRAKSVATGWLHYEPGRKGVRGRYWVVIPSGIYPVNSGKESGEESVEESGNHSYLLPNDLLPTCSELNSEQSARLSEFSFPVIRNNGVEWPLPPAKLAEYRETYPGLDIESELRKARQWCRDTKPKRKTPSGMPGFLNRWFDRAQNRGQSSAPNNPESRVATKEDAETWRP